MDNNTHQLPSTPMGRFHRQARRVRLPRWIPVTLCSIISLFLAGALVFMLIAQTGRRSLLQGMTPADSDVAVAADTSVEAGLVTHNGKKYRYNQNLINILCMGIDNKSSPLEAHADWGSSGQSDSNMLVLYDTSAQTLRILALSRDTITEIKCYDQNQQFMGWAEDHLSLGFAQRDGSTLSCEDMTDAVSRLLYGVPIQGYCALSVQKVGDITDLFGGVTVTMPNDDLNQKPYYYKEGDEVTLNGEAARTMVQTRNTAQDGSNNGRMARQKVFLSAFIKTAKTQVSANPTMLFSIMDSMKGYYLTNIGTNEIAYLAQNIGSVTFSMRDNFYTLPGENDYSHYFDEFHVDDDALFELILELFYEEVNE